MFTHRIARGRTLSQRWVRVLFVCMLGLAFGCTSPVKTPLPAPHASLPGTYKIGPPDQLLISIMPEPIIEREVVVRPDGKISMDLIGDVQAQGRTTEEIAREIEQRIARYKRDARTTVYVSQSLTETVTVFGQVGRPATFALERETRVAAALGIVGGTNQFASMAKVLVVRQTGNETVVLPVNLKDILRGDLSTNVLLTGGDIIVVPPNAVAKVGFFFQTLLLPFQPLLNAAGSASGFIR